MQYIKMFGYQWLEGSIRVDLDSAGRGVWADILALASISRRAGYLERSIGIPYTDDELADKFKVKMDLLQRTIGICINEGRLLRGADGTLSVTNWNKYQDIPLGSEADNKYKKSDKDNHHPKSTEEIEAITRKMVNSMPTIARDTLTTDFQDTVIRKTGEVHTVKDGEQNGNR